MSSSPERYIDPDFSAVDPILFDWTEKQDLRLDRDHNGYVVRSIWWKGKIQLWFGAPDSENYLVINAAERRSDLPSQWGRSLKLRVPVVELSAALDSVWSEVQSWAV